VDRFLYLIHLLNPRVFIVRKLTLLPKSINWLEACNNWFLCQYRCLESWELGLLTDITWTFTLVVSCFLCGNWQTIVPSSRN